MQGILMDETRPSNKTQESFMGLKAAWRYDETVQERLSDAVEAFRDYFEKRSRHVALSRASREEYDDDAVRAADRVRTGAHNRAIYAAADINRFCRLINMAEIAPVCPDGIDPLKSKPHRNAVAHFVADMLGLDEDERYAMGLR